MTNKGKRFLPKEWLSQDESASTQTEFLYNVDAFMKRFFIGQHVRSSIWEFYRLLTPQVLRTVSENPKKWLPLHKMVNHLETGSRFDFWRIVFENREFISREELLQVWYDCLDDRGSHSFQRVNIPNGFDEYASGVENPEKQRNSVITNQLLIDDPIVSFRYCQVHKPGWQRFQYIHGRRHQTLKMPDAMRKAIHEDSLPVFAMHLDMVGRKISFSLLTEILENKAVSIFRYLLENKMVADDVITLSELCCYLTAWFQDGISVPMLTVMDELQPGLIKSVTDVFGRNLLWFAVQNMKTGWFHPDCKLTPFLLEHGCDPLNTNQIGLSWQEITNGLPPKLKVQMMRRRYNMEHYSATSPKLQINQPLVHLNNLENKVGLLYKAR